MNRLGNNNEVLVLDVQDVSSAYSIKDGLHILKLLVFY